MSEKTATRERRKVHLTKRTVEALTYEGDGKSRPIFWDDKIPGFGVRVSPAGRKTFVFFYRTQDRRQRFMTLGVYDSLSVEKARKKAKEIQGRVVDGEDPAGEKQARRKQPTVRNLVKEFLREHVDKRLRPSTAKEYRRQLLTHVVPAWGSRSAASITRADVARLHAEIGRRAPIQANRTLAAVSKMFSYALTTGFLPEGAQNPARGIERFKEAKRDRWVKPAELPRIAEAIAHEANPYVRGAFWLILLTGLRRGEVMRLRWEDVDLERRELRIPQTKAGRAHYVPLSEPAVALLSNLLRQEGNPYVFPGLKEGDHIRDLNGPWARIRKRAGVEDVRLHDLRRTVGSWLATAGASLPLIGKVLNHSTPATTQVYARLAEDPARKALEEHGRRIVEAAQGLRLVK